MKIGELFVSLGVKGSEKTVGAIAGVRSGLKETASMSLEAKAGILGALYALEQLTAKSGAQGTNLTNMNAELGVSVQTLQQYEYAARQVGLANEDVDASFGTLQSSLNRLKYEGATNKWFALFAQRTGTTANDLDQLREHPEQMIQKLQQFYTQNSDLDKSLRNEVLKQFGVGNLIPAFARNKFTPEVLSKAPAYSDKEVANLDRANTAWSNLGTTIQMAIGHMNAKYGGTLVKDISELTPKVIHLVESFVKLGDKIHLLENVGKVFEGWGEIFEGLSAVVDAFGDEKKMEQLKQNITTFFKQDLPNAIMEGTGATKESAPLKDTGMHTGGPNAEKGYNYIFGPKLGEILERADAAFLTGGQSDSYVSILKDLIVELATSKGTISAPGTGTPKTTLQLVKPSTTLPAPAAAATPKLPPTVNHGGSASVEFNQNLNFHGEQAKDALKIGEETRRGVAAAYRQNPALNRAT